LEVSPEGIALAVVGGFLTTLLGALVPAIQAGRVSPMQASQSAARGTGSGVIWVLAAVGVGFIGVHWAMEAYLDPGLWLNHRAVGLAGMMSIYLGYALLTPLAARTLGKVGVFVAAGVFGIRRQLLADQVERAAMRSGVICCGLMVGLSLIVCVVVHTESIIAGWDFPKDLAEAFVWSPGAVKMSTAEKLKDVKGVKQYMLAQDIFCKVVGDTQEWQTMTKPTFVAGSVQSFSEMLEAKFLEGDRYEARDKLLAGGYVLVTPEFASSRGKHVGDSLGVTLNNRVANFEIAGVVESPALDIAASFFNAEGYLMVAAAGAILGTFDDVKKNFGLDTYSFVMLDFDLPDEPVPADFDPERAIVEGKVGLVELVDPRTMSREDLYRWSRERTVLKEISAAMGAFNPIMGSVRELKKAIDRDLRLATLLFATIPAVALLVAGLGVANLMMANVLSRSKQIAVLRSIGATRWQVMRMVIGEALVLSVIGNAVGAALGLHAAYTVNVMTFKLWGFLPEWQVPLNYIGAALGFTTVVCLIAGVIPARYAARTNIISALQGA
jgi:putative ABC transport system permease protein